MKFWKISVIAGVLSGFLIMGTGPFLMVLFGLIGPVWDISRVDVIKMGLFNLFYYLIVFGFYGLLLGFLIDRFKDRLSSSLGIGIIWGAISYSVPHVPGNIVGSLLMVFMLPRILAYLFLSMTTSFLGLDSKILYQLFFLVFSVIFATLATLLANHLYKTIRKRNKFHGNY